MRIKSSFHINNFALSLALKERLRTTQKWPIVNTFSQYLILATLISKVSLANHSTRMWRQYLVEIMSMKHSMEKVLTQQILSYGPHKFTTFSSFVRQFFLKNKSFKIHTIQNIFCIFTTSFCSQLRDKNDWECKIYTHQTKSKSVCSR